MIEYIRGAVAELTPTYVVIETGGIGYIAGISLTTYAAFENRAEVKALIHEIIREDTRDLFAFATAEERDIFRLLIGVSGIGANTARTILSAYNSAELASIITGGDHARLKSVKGIGAKTAERIIVDLRDKIKATDTTFNQQPENRGEVFDEAKAALVMLGYPKQAVAKILAKIFDADPLIKVEGAIRKALTML